MKTGRTLQQLAAEVERQRETRRDFVAPTDVMTIQPIEGDVMLALPGHDAFDINALGHRQIGQHAGVPAAYYDRMRTAAPGLLATNLNHWLTAEPSKRMIRTLDGHVRAFLSENYRPLDNYDLLEAVLPVLARPGLVIMSCEVTETRLYIKVVDERLVRDVPTGRRMGDGTHTIFDTCSPVAIISNSEVGHGSLKIESGVYTKACTNLAMFSDRALRKYHVGGKQDAIGEGFERFLTDETKQARDLAVWMQVRDVLAGAFDEAKFEALIKVFAGSVEDKIEGDPIKVIDLTTKRFGLTEGERGGVLKHLIEGGDLTRYGLHAAITRSAQDHADYDRATEIERIGGQVIELGRSEWKALAPAE
jgi:hypothetical protein